MNITDVLKQHRIEMLASLFNCGKVLKIYEIRKHKVDGYFELPFDTIKEKGLAYVFTELNF
jgi:hypothetical protein